MPHTFQRRQWGRTPVLRPASTPASWQLLKTAGAGRGPPAQLWRAAPLGPSRNWEKYVAHASACRRGLQPTMPSRLGQAAPQFRRELLAELVHLGRHDVGAVGLLGVLEEILAVVL